MNVMWLRWRWRDRWQVHLVICQSHQPHASLYMVKGPTTEYAWGVHTSYGILPRGPGISNAESHVSSQDPPESFSGFQPPLLVLHMQSGFRKRARPCEMKETPKEEATPEKAHRRGH